MSRLNCVTRTETPPTGRPEEDDPAPLSTGEKREKKKPRSARTIMSADDRKWEGPR